MGKKFRVLAMAMVMFCMVGFAGNAFASKDVRFVYVPWTCVTVKTEVATHLLNALGYNASSMLLSVPIAYQAMASDQADIFLGNWMPTMQSIAEPHFESGRVQQFSVIMDGAKYTLAVPTYAYEAGLRDFSDIAKYADKLEGKIYGIEEGNDGNEVIELMINENMFNLGDFELVPSSETAMLTQVQNFARNENWIVFLGWSPHWMNKIIDMSYLTGSDEQTFGENDGTATVYINIRTGFDQQQPNVATFLNNYLVPIEMVNDAMNMLHQDSSMAELDAGMAWLRKNPEVYRGWMDGVTTADGRPALPVIEALMVQ
ncbi:glycine betaine/proline transport system substrate-binding protein [Desulfonatronum thiosulfatophilum]|uniref:Glycine betaine/proline transport system substrate-binding protein n=1 Tax=Desulfonatronum thiosulfatophilum TaxID=617002 RepID=A0A1G6DB35_9BACT|nr:ABC transporter substrate-binding protein [Desulfonatronum thiosulfatophilum]SDB42374.1 glycine betaine/proline transport system substrate-binding protein [Desulfonatronum thiosulfatophilum]